MNFDCVAIGFVGLVRLSVDILGVGAIMFCLPALIVRLRVKIVCYTQANCKARNADGQTELPVGQETQR